MIMQILLIYVLHFKNKKSKQYLSDGEGAIPLVKRSVCVSLVAANVDGIVAAGGLLLCTTLVASAEILAESVYFR